MSLAIQCGESYQCCGTNADRLWADPFSTDSAARERPVILVGHAGILIGFQWWVVSIADGASPIAVRTAQVPLKRILSDG